MAVWYSRNPTFLHIMQGVSHYSPGVRFIDCLTISPGDTVWSMCVFFLYCTRYESCVNLPSRGDCCSVIWQYHSSTLEGKYLQVWNFGYAASFLLAHKVIILSHTGCCGHWTWIHRCTGHTDESPDFRDFFFIPFFLVQTFHTIHQVFVLSTVWCQRRTISLGDTVWSMCGFFLQLHKIWTLCKIFRAEGIAVAQSEKTTQRVSSGLGVVRC